MKDSRDIWLALPPGRPRVLIPRASRAVKSRALEMYQPASKLGQMLKLAAVVNYRFGFFHPVERLFARAIEKIAFPAAVAPILQPDMLSALTDEFRRELSAKEIAIAIAPGTPNRYQKVAMLAMDKHGRALAVAKVGATPEARALIANEIAALRRISSLGLTKGQAPRLLGAGALGEIHWLLQSALLEGRPSSNRMGPGQLAFLEELAGRTARVEPLGEAPLVRRLAEALHSRTAPWNPEYAAERPVVAEWLDRLRSTIDGSLRQAWSLSAAHGDFTPWNMRLPRSGPAIFDWEYFQEQAPLGWDAARFFYMIERLVRKRPLQKIAETLLNGPLKAVLDRLEAVAGGGALDRETLLRLFIADQALDASRLSIVESARENTAGA